MWLLLFNMWSLAGASLVASLLGQMGSWASTTLMGVVLGACEGSAVCSMSYVPAYLYGRKHLGAITGLLVTFAAVGSGMGPILVAVSKACRLPNPRTATLTGYS